jgi:hypothetical protein
MCNRLKKKIFVEKTAAEPQTISITPKNANGLATAGYAYKV